MCRTIVALCKARDLGNETLTESPGVNRARFLLRTEIRAILAVDDLESAERIHIPFRELEPIPQFKATAKLGEFLETRFSQAF